MELKFILEALLFSAQKPLSPKELRELLAAADAAAATDATRACRDCGDAEIEAALTQLAQEHEAAQRSYRLVCVAGAWQFVTQPDYAPWLRALVGQRLRPPRLSQPALETLAIIAYRQPITRAAIEQVRGVNVDGVMQTLLERGLVQGVGRAQVVGHPMNYGTTALFLEYFGLRSVDDLPAADELRRVPLAKPAVPGLATPPPENLQPEVGSQSAESVAPAAPRTE
jgi:segregation and condensation protein B